MKSWIYHKIFWFPLQKLNKSTSSFRFLFSFQIPDSSLFWKMVKLWASIFSTKVKIKTKKPSNYTWEKSIGSRKWFCYDFHLPALKIVQLMLPAPHSDSKNGQVSGFSAALLPWCLDSPLMEALSCSTHILLISVSAPVTKIQTNRLRFIYS